jgi:restriction system protein
LGVLVAAKPKAPQMPQLHPFELVHPLIHALVPLWPLWALIAMVGLLKVGVELAGQARLRRSGMVEINHMSGSQFEQRLGVMFRDLGYRADVIGAIGDFGADILLTKDGQKTAVQAKRWNRRVGIRAVQEVRSARDYYAADAAIVVTNGEFTKAARALAAKTEVALWNGSTLMRSLEGAAGSAGSKVKPSSPVPIAAHCARCGVAVSARVREYCESHRKRFGGLVYCYSHQRAVR